MRFTVIYRPSAHQDLARIWTDAADRSAVTSASHVIDEALAQEPHAVGEARSGSERILFVEPLAVAYDVNDDDCLVTVHAVWRWLT